jgi:nitrogen-specific signal transduction histidine kinase
MAGVRFQESYDISLPDIAQTDDGPAQRLIQWTRVFFPRGQSDEGVKQTTTHIRVILKLL